MIELNNEPTLHENDNDAEAASPAGVMFITILLLIGGLLLTSAMFIHYGFKGTGENGESISGLTRVLEMAKSNLASDRAEQELSATTPKALPADSPADTPDTAAKPSGFNLKNLFSKNGNGSIRWPRLKLAGFGLPADGEVGFAIINGKHIIEGSTINGGVTLVEILSYGVLVEYKGETKTLIVEIAD